MITASEDPNKKASARMERKEEVSRLTSKRSIST